MKKILIIDDDSAIRLSMKTILEYESYQVELAEDGFRGFEIYDQVNPDMVFLDIKMPGMDGMEVLKKLLEKDRELPVIMISAHGNIETAVEALRMGAFDFIEKPLDTERILVSARNAAHQRVLLKENRSLKEVISRKYKFIGESDEIKSIKKIIEQVGPTNARVLIMGENGTGKEIVAREIHRLSSRVDKPFVQVNCAAIPEELIESELFGHEKGSFTGATSKKTGKFEQANFGTLFLDEVGDMSLSAQSKVLRILQEGEMERVGGNKTIYVDVRVLSATNKKLLEEVENNRFREDLYYRLNVVPIIVPPLRERVEDIEIIAKEFLKEYCLENGFPIKEFSKEAISVLKNYFWPGNVRELKNLVERTTILTQSKVIKESDIPPFEQRESREHEKMLFSSCHSFQDFKDQCEKMFLEEQLRKYRWNITRTAKALDMQRSNVYKKMEKFGIKSPDALEELEAEDKKELETEDASEV